MTFQELLFRWRVDRFVRGVIYLLTGFALVFLLYPITFLGAVMAVILFWAVLKTV